MMRWGRKKSVSTSTSSSSSVSWFSKLSGSSDLKLAKEKKQDDEASQNMSSKSSLSSTKPRNDTRERSGRFQMKSDEKFEEIMSSVKKKVQEFQIKTRGYLEAEATHTVIMTPRIKVNRDKVRCERRDQRLLEQKTLKAEQDAKKPARRITRSHSREDSLLLDNTETKPAPQWQKLKEVKLREVKLKAAEQQRKSLYIKRELNSSKVRVFSPRASEKCRVKAIEDLKKAKLRAREHEVESESFAVVKCSSDPQKDFRDSMIEMIMENGINHPDELKELLVCYLRLNTDEYHDMIITVFQQVHNDLKFHYFGAE